MESSDVDSSPPEIRLQRNNSPHQEHYNYNSVLPRKLMFSSPGLFNRNGCGSSNTVKRNEESQESVSPPYRKVRALRLFDSPATPKTIIQKSSGKCLNYLSDLIDLKSKPIQQIVPSLQSDRPKALPLHARKLHDAEHTANVNPFTPNSLLSHNKKRCRTQFGLENCHNNSLPTMFSGQITSKSDSDEENSAEMFQAPKRLALQDTNISRYKKEFLEISLIGVGEFGLVYQCLNRLDGCIYAIKKSIKPVAGSSFEKRALNEVWAHAVLGKHDNVVRYYSAWAEDNHMLIQNEYCNGGSLQSLIKKRYLVESELRILLLHIAEGLKYIHSNDLVHMDLKSGNIFLAKVPTKTQLVPTQHDGLEEIYEELVKSDFIITYKIGDLGHVTSYKDANVEEGDCRYLSNEILQEDFRNLFKADIFSLGITLFEAAGGGPLPKNGPEWHKLRNGEVPEIPSLSKEFNNLIKLMTHPDPEKRPSSTSIFNHPVLCSLELKTKSQLNQELTIERRKNDILLRKLKEAKSLIKSYEQKDTAKLKFKSSHHTPTVNNERCLRSYTKKKRKGLTATNENFRERNKNVICNF